MKLRDLVPLQFWTRKCRGCREPMPHSHHLTWWGRYYFSTFGG